MLKPLKSIIITLIIFAVALVVMGPHGAAAANCHFESGSSTQLPATCCPYKYPNGVSTQHLPSKTACKKDPATCPSGNVDPNDDSLCAPLGNNTACTGANTRSCLASTPLYKDINTVVQVLSALVGVVVVGTIIVGGIQYMTASDNAQAVTSAKSKMTNALIALLAFLFLYAFLQWLIPGGLFG